MEKNTSRLETVQDGRWLGTAGKRPGMWVLMGIIVIANGLEPFSRRGPIAPGKNGGQKGGFSEKRGPIIFFSV